MSQAPEKFIQLSHLQKLRRCEQVAAVCYRAGGAGIEFLLVQTRNGRWTFPKGGTEPGLTHAQAAAVEAFEEAGVHGRIEEASFTRYNCPTGYIRAHLCEVSRLDPPQEFGRNPSWFSPQKAKRRLREGRKSSYATEISGVVDRAVACIERQHLKAVLHGAHFDGAKRDSLQKVQFEAPALEGMQTFVRYVRREADTAELAIDGYGRRLLRGAKILQLNAPTRSDATFTTAKAARRPPQS